MPKQTDQRGSHLHSIDPRSLSLKLRFSIASTREAIADAADSIVSLAQEQGCTDEEITDMSIALREALANAIIHGNRGNPDKHVLLRVYGHPDVGVLISVLDQGPGFDPANVPDPTRAERIELNHGRGIFLMRELMDHVEHRRGGREVLLFKRCSHQTPEGGDPDASGPPTPTRRKK